MCVASEFLCGATLACGWLVDLCDYNLLSHLWRRLNYAGKQEMPKMWKPDGKGRQSRVSHGAPSWRNLFREERRFHWRQSRSILLQELRLH